MKFLCTKVKSFWLTSPQNIEKVNACGLKVKDPLIGIELKEEKPTTEELNLIHEAIEELFGENKRAFPIKVIEI